MNSPPPPPPPPRFFNKALFRSNGIARQIILALVLFSSLITAILTGAELYFDYREDLQGIDERINSIGKVHLSTLSESIWIAEKTQIQNQLNGLLNLRDIEAVQVVVDGHVQWSAGAQQSARHTERVIALYRSHRGQNLKIGDLHVIASVDNVLERLWSRLVVMLLSNAIKTFLVTAFVLLILQQMVGQHLEHISIYLRHFAKHFTASESLQLNRPAKGRWRPDALDHVAGSVNLMRAEIERFSHELQETNQQLSSIINHSPLAIYTLDQQQRLTSWNPAAEKMFGWSAQEVIGQTLPFIADKHQNDYVALQQRLDHHETLQQMSLMCKKHDGSAIYASLSAAPLYNNSGQMVGTLTMAADVTEHHLAEARVEFLANHDVLTGLPNRLLLQERFDQAQNQALRTDTKLALVFLDLDNFKDINDTMGHAIGDALLREIALRLSASLPEINTISRQGGDEFLILLPHLSNADDCAPILLKLLEQLQGPFHIYDHEIATSVSMGAAIFPDDGIDFESLSKKADMAMYQAKSDGRNTYRFFSDAMNVKSVEHLFMRNGLRRALEQNELVLYYQPQIDLHSGAVTGVEALMRWNRPDVGMVPPGQFIPVAEESGLIVPMGDWALRQACEQIVAWQRAGLPSMTMAVNLSAVQFRRGDIEQSVLRALQDSGCPPAQLELELTESILIQDVDTTMAAISRLKALGVKISIDDFGTGYSSLSYLKRLDIDKLKIDQSFVRDLVTAPDDAAIVCAIIQMAHSLGLSTIAEGVETAEIRQQLHLLGCNEAQGYFFARPMPAHDVERFVREHTTASTSAPAAIAI